MPPPGTSGGISPKPCRRPRKPCTSFRSRGTHSSGPLRDPLLDRPRGPGMQGDDTLLGAIQNGARDACIVCRRAAHQAYLGSLLEIYAATLAISSALRVSFFGCLTVPPTMPFNSVSSSASELPA